MGGHKSRSPSAESAGGERELSGCEVYADVFETVLLSSPPPPPLSLSLFLFFFWILSLEEPFAGGEVWDGYLGRGGAGGDRGRSRQTLRGGSGLHGRAGRGWLRIRSRVVTYSVSLRRWVNTYAEAVGCFAFPNDRGATLGGSSDCSCGRSRYRLCMCRHEAF